MKNNQQNQVMASLGRQELMYVLLILCCVLINLESIRANPTLLPSQSKLKITNSESLIQYHEVSNASSKKYIKKWKLVWSDEFDGATLKAENWNIVTGNGCPVLCGFGNNEKQYYSKNNIEVEKGVLKIIAKKDSVGKSTYTSARINSSNKVSVKYGKIDIKARLPKGKGIWPAIWMMGDNKKLVHWPSCGEIDIMELRGSDPGSVCGTVHFQNSELKHEYAEPGCYALGSKDFSTKFHIFSVLWDEEGITWLVDNIDFYRIDYPELNLAEGINPFLDNFYLLLNIAVGGHYDGDPDGTTVFPQIMEVDYVRVFQKQ